MATYAFPALGFDPAPGHPDAVAATGSACTRLAADLADDAATLQGLGNAASWRGEAADAFTDRLGQLPQDLDRAQGSYGRVGSALTGYAATLREGQAQARRLEEQAAAAQATAAAQARAADQLGAELRDTPSPAAGGPTPDTSGTEAAQRAAQTRADAAAADHADAVRAARALLDRLQADGDRAARTVRDAADAPYHEPGFFEKALSAIDSWIDDNADILRTLSGGLKIVSAVAGVLSFIPVLTPIAAPIALATGAAALGIDAALVASGNGDWKALAVDAALMAVPGVGRIASRAIAGQRAAGATARGADAAVDTGRAMPQTTRVYRVEGPGNARLSIDDAGDVTIKGDQMLFLNFGQRARADEFLARRLEQGYDGTQIKRFDVDSAYVDELRATSVLESQKRLDPNAPLRVDVNQAPDQFGLRAHHFDELRRRIRPGTGVVE